MTQKIVKSKNLILMSAIIFSVITTVLLFVRLFFAVDLTDESYYSAQSLVFARGFRPYLDETMVHQSFAILLQPLVKTYLLLNGDAQGIVLFFRLSFFTALLATCALIFSFLKAYVPKVTALLTAVLFFSFWPFSIPSLSYNTMGVIFFTNGLLVLLSKDLKDTYRVPISIVFFALCSFCYPTWVISIVFSILVLFAYNKKNILNSGRTTYLATAATIAILAFLGAYIVFGYIGLDRLLEILHYTGSHKLQIGGFAKIQKIAMQLSKDGLFLVVICAGFLSSFWMAKKQHFVAPLVIFGTITAIFLFPPNDLASPKFHLSISALILTSVIIALRNLQTKSFDLWSQIAMFALVSGSVCAWTSGNGFANFAVGGALGIISFGFFLNQFFSNYRYGGQYLTAAVLMGIITFQGISQYRSVFGDLPYIEQLNHVVTNGPYKWLRTTSEKVNYMAELEGDIKDLDIDLKSVAFLESFMHGYLFTNAKYKTPAIWIYSLSEFRYDRRVISDYFAKKENKPDYIFWQKSMLVSNQYSYQLEHQIPDSFKEEILPYYRLIADKKHYQIYVLNKNDQNKE